MALFYTRRVRAVPVVCVLVTGAAACLSTPPPADVDARIADAVDADPCPDGDGDGWPADLPGCGRYRDCADDNSARHPGALELDDGVADLDCDGAPLTEQNSIEDLDISSLSEDGIRVIARHLALEFRSEAAYQLTSMQTTNGVNDELLYIGDSREKWSGTNVWEAYFSTVSPGNTPSTVTTGPAVLQWLVPFDSMGALIGSSLYTITVDGRIYRSDAFSVSADPSGGGHSVTSYIALDATKFVDVAWESGAPDLIDPGAFVPYFEPFADQATWLCARTGEQDVVWANVATSGPLTNPVSSGPRITSSDGDGPQVALQYDWQFSVETVTTGQFSGHFLLATTFTNTQITCGTGAAQARGFYDPAIAMVRAPGHAVTNSEDDIGIRDGFLERGGYYLVDAGAGPGLTVEIDAAGGRQPPVQSTWRVRGIPADPLPVVERDGIRLVHGDQYRIQPDGDGGLWLVMFDILADNQTLSLVVPRQPDP
jgi:hypothetical protein